MLHFCSAARQHVLGMTQDKRDSVSPVGFWSVGAESEWWVAVWGEAREREGRDIFCLSVECGLQDGAPCGARSDSHFCFAVGDEVGLWGWVVLGASSQGVAGARLGSAQLALAAVSLPPERMLAGVPALEVGVGVVGQGV